MAHPNYGIWQPLEGMSYRVRTVKKDGKILVTYCEVKEASCRIIYIVCHGCKQNPTKLYYTLIV